MCRNSRFSSLYQWPQETFAKKRSAFPQKRKTRGKKKRITKLMVNMYWILVSNSFIFDVSSPLALGISWMWFKFINILSLYVCVCFFGVNSYYKLWLFGRSLRYLLSSYFAIDFKRNLLMALKSADLYNGYNANILFYCA